MHEKHKLVRPRTTTTFLSEINLEVTLIMTTVANVYMTKAHKIVIRKSTLLNASIVKSNSKISHFKQFMN